MPQAGCHTKQSWCDPCVIMLRCQSTANIVRQGMQFDRYSCKAAVAVALPWSVSSLDLASFQDTLKCELSSSLRSESSGRHLRVYKHANFCTATTYYHIKIRKVCGAVSWGSKQAGKQGTTVSVEVCKRSWYACEMCLAKPFSAVQCSAVHCIAMQCSAHRPPSQKLSPVPELSL